MDYKYAYDGNEDNTAKVFARDLGISTKTSVEICNFLRGKNTEKAKLLLGYVIAKERPIPMKRYNMDTAHKRGSGIAAGKFPIKAAEHILNVIKSAESNAVDKGLSVKELYIKHISAHQASRPWHYGRQRGRKMKRTHIQIVLGEKKPKKDKETKK